MQMERSMMADDRFYTDNAVDAVLPHRSLNINSFSDHTHPRKAEMICLVALFPEMSPEADSMQPITTEKQGTMNPSEIYRPGGRYAIFHSGSLFNMIMGCIIIQEVKGLTNVQEEDLCKISVGVREKSVNITHLSNLYVTTKHKPTLSSLSSSQPSSPSMTTASPSQQVSTGWGRDSTVKHSHKKKSCVEPLFDQEKKQRIVIIGAGPAGLGAAHRLYELGVLRSKTQVIIFEQSEKAGGLASSYRDQHGFLWDNGAHVVSSRYRYYNDIMQKAISEWNVHSRASSLFKMDSSGKMNFVPCAVMNSTCNERVAEHPNTKKRAAQSLQCEEFLKHNKPVTPTAMSLWGSRCVARQQDLPTVVKTTASLSNDSGAYSPGWDSCQLFHYPKYGGSGAIWKAIARQLPEGWFHYNFTVTGVDSEHRTVYVKDSRYKKSYSLAYDFLINTSPLNQFVGMIDDSDKTLNNVRCLSENLIHSHTHIVGIGLRGRPPDILADKSEIFFDSVSLFYRVTVLSNYADDIVPQAGNFWSLMCEISEQAAKKTVRNKDFIQRVIDVLVNHGLINSEDVVSHYHRSIGNSYPVPFPHIEEFINTIQSWLESKFIYSRGTYGGWDCEVGNQDQSFMQGVEAADLIMRGLLEATHSHHTLVDFFKTDRILDCTPVVVPRYEYVISVYNEDITWAKKDTEHTHIYDKSGGKIDEYLEFFQWQHLPNVGREGHTYLYHIITNYNRLADVTVFLQGAISNHATLVYMDISRYVDEAKEKGLAFKTYGHFSQWNRLRHISKWKVEYEKGLMRKAEKSVGEFWKAIFGTEHPSSVKVAYAACFGVTRKRILAHPKTFYKDLISYVDDHANPEEGHYLERLWPAIFGAK